MCLATCPGAQISHTVETVYKTGHCLQKATVVVSGRDTWSSALGSSISETLSMLCGSDELAGKTGGRTQKPAPGRLPDGGGVGAWGTLWRRQVSADATCVGTQAAESRRDERDFEEGQDGISPKGLAKPW